MKEMLTTMVSDVLLVSDTSDGSNRFCDVEGESMLTQDIWDSVLLENTDTFHEFTSDSEQDTDDKNDDSDMQILDRGNTILFREISFSYSIAFYTT